MDAPCSSQIDSDLDRDIKLQTEGSMANGIAANHKLQRGSKESSEDSGIRNVNDRRKRSIDDILAAALAHQKQVAMGRMPP